MANIVGVELPKDKRLEIALTYIFGIGKTYSKKILSDLAIDESIRVKDLSIEDEKRIREEIQGHYIVEGELRTRNVMDIKRLMGNGSYRGLRHKRGLPCRGQNTKNNAMTRKKRRKKR